MSKSVASAIIYFDGGGSGIRAEGRTPAGAVMRHSYAGFSHGEINLEDYLSQCVTDFASKFDNQISRAVLAVATLPPSEAAYSHLAERIFLNSTIAELWICSDSVSAAALTIAGDGVVIVAGTGITALAIGHNRTSVHNYSGHGYLIGDEGSAFWIGSKGLNLALRASDERGGDLELLEAACEFFETTPSELPHKVHQLERPVFSIAQFAQVVSEKAIKNNRAALSILDIATSEIVLIATTAKDECESKEFSVVLMGGVLDPNNLLTKMVLKKLHELGLRAKTSTEPPIQGAKVLCEMTDPSFLKDVIKVFHRS